MHLITEEDARPATPGVAANRHHSESVSVPLVHRLLRRSNHTSIASVATSELARERTRQLAIDRRVSSVGGCTCQETCSIRYIVVIAKLQYCATYLVSHRAIERPGQPLEYHDCRERASQRLLGRRRTEKTQFWTGGKLKCQPPRNLSAECKLDDVPVRRLVQIAESETAKTIKESDCVVASDLG